MVEIKNLNKRFGNFLALDSLNLSISRGELFGFVGPNGAGKTTTMRILAGLLSADSGEASVAGLDALRSSQQVREKIGYMPDFFGVYDNLKVIEYMEFYAAVYGINGEKARKLCMELLELVNLAEKADFYVDHLSRGMKQRLCLARCLVHKPELLILDEPASGLDPRARYEMKEILRNLHEMGKTIIISSHILPELAEMCTTVGIIENGSMVMKGTVEEIMSNLNASRPLIIKVIDGRENAIRILKENTLVRNLSLEEDKLIAGFDGKEREEAQLLGELIRKGVSVAAFHRRRGNLESVFMKVTGQKEVLEG